MGIAAVWNFAPRSRILNDSGNGMRSFLKLFLGLIAIAPFILVGLVFLAIDSLPLVDRAAEVTPASIERANRILNNNDPRRLKPGTVRTIVVSQADFDLAANYLAHRFVDGSARANLHSGVTRITASLPLPLLPVQRFVNLEATLKGGTGLPKFGYLSVGRLTLPGWASDWLVSRVLEHLFGEEEVVIFNRAIQNISVGESKLSLTYEWRRDFVDTMRNVMLPPEEQQRLRFYHERLVAVIRETRSESISLIDLMVPLFQLAEGRSIDGDPVAENRAAILVLTLYANGSTAGSLLPSAKTWPSPDRRKVTLSKRDDFPKHFIISAALAAYAGTPLADAVGVYKEIADSHGGSGFSFNDIAADRAGAMFGEQAAKNASSAKRLQQRVAAGVSELFMMPITEDLPEYMSEDLFKHRYGGIDAPAYNAMMADIERRVARLPLYR
jgi:hypothetical protein